MQVADIPDDGRYALIVDTPATALGVTNTALAGILNKALNATRKRHDNAVTPA